MSGYDAPAQPSEDLLNRWPFARQVYRVVENTPPEWSVRIGIHGKWGDGKTTVLQYIADLARKRQGVVVKFTPWSAKTRDELWRDFIVAIAQSLQDEGITLGDSVAARLVSNLLKYEDVAKGLSTVNPWAQVVSHGFFRILSDFLRPDGSVFPNIHSRLKGRRVHILVDDLDRAEPEILPFLFLALRDVFDLPGFAFILAFDDEIVADALENVRSFEKHGLSFLDKLFDFSFTIPELTQGQVQRFLQHMLTAHLGSVDNDAVAAVASLVQRNPRKLKRFVRHLTTLQPTLSRLDDDEVDTRVLYLSLLVTLESPLLLERLMQEIENANVDLLSLMRNGKENHKHIAEMKKTIGLYNLESRGDYLLPLMDEFLRSSLFRLTRASVTARL